VLGDAVSDLRPHLCRQARGGQGAAAEWQHRLGDRAAVQPGEQPRTGVPAVAVQARQRRVQVQVTGDNRRDQFLGS
jgi:hypothetical protein